MFRFVRPVLGLMIMLMGSLVMIGSRDYQLAIPGEILLAFGSSDSYLPQA